MKKFILSLLFIATLFSLKVSANFDDDIQEIVDIYTTIDKWISSTDINTLKSELKSIKNVSQYGDVLYFLNIFLKNQNEVDLDNFLNLINRVTTNQKWRSNVQEATDRLLLATTFEEKYQADIYDINKFLDRIFVINNLKNIESSLNIIFNYQNNFSINEIFTIIDGLSTIAFNYQSSETVFNIINHFLKHTKNINCKKIIELIQSLTTFSSEYPEEFTETTISLIWDYLSYNRETDADKIINLLSTLKWSETKNEIKNLISNISNENKTVSEEISKHAASSSSSSQDILNELKNLWDLDSIVESILNGKWLSNTNTTSPTWENKIIDNSSKKSTNGTTTIWREIFNDLKNKWRTEEQIKEEMDFYWIDASAYFKNNTLESTNQNFAWNYIETYQSRSCKNYNIIYDNNLWVYTSTDLKLNEYFINIDYLKRYIDSKNPQKEWCPTNYRISNTYNDTSNSNDKYIAPNWKIYYIFQTNNLYSSNELINKWNFTSITQLKYYIRDNNPLIWM